MKVTPRNKTIITVIAAVILLGVIAVFTEPKKPTIVPPVKTPEAIPAKTTPATPVAPVSVKGEVYHSLTLVTASPEKELIAAVGADNAQAVLEINRIDAANLTKGKVLVVPNDFSDTAALTPFPQTLAIASDIPKLMVVSLQMQDFAIYESGTLVRWGGVNTGKQSTPTPAQLFFANWKGKKVTSSEDDSWILPWYVNLDNTRGVSMHQYELPGYPASHACVRMFEQDAEWIYDWVDQWKVSDDGQTVLAHGTPVLIFGKYGYGKTAPWKNLVKNPDATTISSDVLEDVVAAHKTAIFAPVQ